MNCTKCGKELDSLVSLSPSLDKNLRELCVDCASEVLEEYRKRR